MVLSIAFIYVVIVGPERGNTVATISEGVGLGIKWTCSRGGHDSGRGERCTSTTTYNAIMYVDKYMGLTVVRPCLRPRAQSFHVK